MKNKKEYESPVLQVTLVELEQGIAAASATLSGGDGNNTYQPNVEDWQDNGLVNEQRGDL
jgi:hypothetical protein